MGDAHILGKPTRRSFVAGAATTVMAGLLAGCAPSQESNKMAQTGEEAEQANVPETKLMRGFCRSQCSCQCTYNLHVRNGQIVRSTAADFPDNNYRGICTKGLTQAARTYSADRLQYPMKRVGERGEGKFERISWDEALETIASKWKAITDEYGLDAFAIKGCGGTMGLINGQMPGTGSWFERFCSVTGASLFRPAVDASWVHAINCVCGIDAYVGGGVWSQLDKSKAVIGWGANPAISNIQDFHWILELRDKGIPYIVIDPVAGPCAAMADWYIPINPSTDGVLALGILKVILDRGQEDTEYIRASTNCTYLVKDEDGKFLRMSDLGTEPTVGEDGEPVDPVVVWDEADNKPKPFDEATTPSLEGVSEVNGIAVKSVYKITKEAVAPYDFKKVTEITGVPQDTVEKLADIYADGPIMNAASYGADHYTNGHYNYIPMITLHVMTHNVGVPGAIVHRGYLMPMHIMNYEGCVFPVDSKGNVAPGNTSIYMPNRLYDLTQGKYGNDTVTPIKGLYLFADGFLSTGANRLHMLKGVEALDFLVVCDAFMTETVNYADIVLPASYWFEDTELFNTQMQHPYIMFQEPIIEPLYESKPAFEIHKLLAEKMGLGEFMDMNQEEFMNLWFDSDGARNLGLSLDAMKKNGVMFSLPDPDYCCGQNGVFATPDGKARIYREDVMFDNKQGRVEPVDESKEHSLYWEPATEADINSPCRKKYPFHVMNEHMRTRNHTGWFGIGQLQEYYPEPFARLNPEDAKELGIVEGDMIKLYNDRGYVVMKATISGALPRKMLGVPRGHLEKEFIEGHFCNISSDEYNQCAANAPYNDQCVAIEKL